MWHLLTSTRVGEGGIEKVGPGGRAFSLGGVVDVNVDYMRRRQPEGSRPSRVGQICHSTSDISLPTHKVSHVTMCYQRCDASVLQDINLEYPLISSFTYDNFGVVRMVRLQTCRGQVDQCQVIVHALQWDGNVWDCPQATHRGMECRTLAGCTAASGCAVYLVVGSSSCKNC